MQFPGLQINSLLWHSSTNLVSLLVPSGLAESLFRRRREHLPAITSALTIWEWKQKSKSMTLANGDKWQSKSSVITYNPEISKALWSTNPRETCFILSFPLLIIHLMQLMTYPLHYFAKWQWQRRGWKQMRSSRVTSRQAMGMMLADFTSHQCTFLNACDAAKASYKGIRLMRIIFFGWK